MTDVNKYKINTNMNSKINSRLLLTVSMFTSIIFFNNITGN